MELVPKTEPGSESAVQLLLRQSQHQAPEYIDILSSDDECTTFALDQDDATCSGDICDPPHQTNIIGIIPFEKGIAVDHATGSDLQHAVGYGTDLPGVIIHTPRKRLDKRSSNLVRACSLSIDDRRYYRRVVRTTRMLFDALRIFTLAEEEKRRRENETNGGEAPVSSRSRTRGDLMAAELMRGHNLWLNRDKRIVGSIPGIEVGDVYFYRMELCVVGLHGQVQAGIDYLPGSQSSNGQPVATSIIVSGGYEDDEDLGDLLIYTGHGGQSKSSKQCTDQKLEGGNLALAKSMEFDIEVRVIRGLKYDGSVSNKVYVYDGLYKIVRFWHELGKSGFLVFKYELQRKEGQRAMGSTRLRYAQNLRAGGLNPLPKGYISLDLSNKKEKIPVLLFNDIDDSREPLLYEYLPQTLFPPSVMYNSIEYNGCDCVSGCIDGCSCFSFNGSEFAYDQNGYLLRGKLMIIECGPSCKCPPSCRNRVAQRGLMHRLEVFRSIDTGWGVRSLDLIQAGTFICEYTGIILNRQQARVLSMNGDSVVYPDRFAKNWVEWGNLSIIYPDLAYPSCFAIPSLDFALDISRRNVASYCSNSRRSPNVLVQLVFYDHYNWRYPHLMLFAMENIPPLTEFCLDYGAVVPNEEGTVKLEICN